MVSIFLAALSLCFLPLFPCLSPDAGSFSLSYNGGKIMTEPISVSLLWFGTGWGEESGQEAIRNAINSLTPSRYSVEDSDQVPTIGNWWEIIRQYKDSSNAAVTNQVGVGAECFYNGPQTDMTLEQVERIGRSAFNKTSIDGNLNCSRVFEVNENGIYLVMFSQLVMFLDSKEQRELTNMCSGSFPLKLSEEMSLRMGWVRAPQNAADQCSTYFHGDFYVGPPNGDERIDSIVGYMLAKIAEEATNSDGRGWVSSDGSGFTVSSSCAAPFPSDQAGFPLFTDSQRNVSFNAVGLNGYRYMVQYIWDQNIRNCALKLSETCSSNAVLLSQPKGYLNAGITVNHTNGLQAYSPNQKCRWYLNYPAAKLISFTINYVLVAPNSDDYLMICNPDSSLHCTVFQSSAENIKDLKLAGSKAYVLFRSGSHVSSESRGWELSYSVGLCNGKEDVYDQEGVIGYNSSFGLPNVEGLSCQWVLHGKPGTPVTLSFTHINISKELDFLAVFVGRKQQMANFSGVYSGSNLPQMNLTGEVMVAFSTQTDLGGGWSVNFHISSPVDRSKKGLLVIIAIVISVVAISFSIALITLAILRRSRNQHMKEMETGEMLLPVSVEIDGGENQIGHGPRAIVYKAILTDGSSVAVKCLKDTTTRTEVEEEILQKTCSHPSIVSLVGYAKDRLQRRYLVFEFMERGTLAWNLRERGEILNWDKRLNIALQISSAIQLLHMYFNPAIYHGNITSENILLDELCNAKLGGFGAANYCQIGDTDPEKPSLMAEDIRGFGVLLVELLRGQPLMNRQGSESLKEINELVGSKEWFDSRLDIPKEQCRIMGLAKLGEIAKWCIGNTQRTGRNEDGPKIGDVLLSLKQVKQLFGSISS